MKPTLRCLYMGVLLGMLSHGIPVAQENIVCGLDQSITSPSGALMKSTTLPPTAKVWTGKLRALIFKVSFSDGPYTITDSTINKTNATINLLYASMSRNTFGFDFKIHPTILAAPGDKATYGANFNSLQSWISSQISAAGLKVGVDYDVYIASFPEINVGWGGLSNMRDGDWINGNYSAGVTAHELGHSLGLPHAHSIEAGTDMFGVPGTTSQTSEYGNPFDVMGHGGSTGHFNMLYKLRVGWKDSNEIKEIKTSGVYRIYAHDNAVHKGRVIGVRIPSGNASYGYWFEYRTVSTSARLGATVSFQGFKSTTNLDEWFLDTTPGSKTSSDENDGVLAPGKEFQDKYGTTTFKTLAINTGVWTEEGWVDLQVTIPGTTFLQPLVRNQLMNGNEGYRQSGLNILGRFVPQQTVQTLVVSRENGITSLILRP